MTLTGTQTATNKTLTSPTINSPTITNATISADSISGYTVSNNGTVYGISVTGGTIGSAALAANSVTNTAVASGGLYASKVYNPYKFRVHNSATQNISDNTVTQMTFDTEDYDTNNNFASNAYTVPANGFYQINVAASFSTSKGVGYYVELWKNGAAFIHAVKQPYPAVTTDGGGTVTINDCIQFSASDVLIVKVWADTSDSSACGILGGTAPQYSYWSGFLVSAT
jgi:hypothetical protein